MNRIATLAIHQLNLSQTLDIQRRLVDTQIQVSSGKVSPNYAGIATEARRLVNLEGAITQTAGFNANITQIDSRLQTMESRIASTFDLATEFRALLVGSLNLENAALLSVNQRAGDFMETLAGLVNTKVDDRFIFAGGRTDTQPIDLATLLAATPPLVNAAEFTGGATTSTTGITSLTGIVSVQVDTGTSGDAFQLTYDDVGQNFTITNLNGGASATLALGGVPPAGQTKDLTFTVGGKRVVLTIDENFNAAAPITTATITGNVDTTGAGVGAFGTISVTSTTGDISKIDQNTVETSGTAANATLTLSSTDGNFVATGVNLSVGSSVVPVVLVNATTGARVTLQVAVTTGLNDAAIASADTEIRLGNFLENVAASDGTISYAQARPGDPGYDPADPAFYKGDSKKLEARIDTSTKIEYGIPGNAPGFEKLFRALFMVRNANVSPGNIDSTTLNSALALALEAMQEIPDLRSGIGFNRQILEQAKSRNEDFMVFTNEAISQIENVDLAEAVTRISAEQTQLEASFSLTARLSQLSLANFLR